MVLVSWETPRKTCLALILLGFRGDFQQSHAVATGTSDVVALPEEGSITECAIGLLAQLSEIEVHERRVHVQCTEASKDQKRQV